MSAKSDLAALIGAANVLEPSARFVEGYRNASGKALCVAQPGSTEDLRSIVRYCSRSAIRLVPQGAHTGLVGAATPDATGDQIVLSTARLAGIEQLDPLDRSITVKAGTLLSSVNAASEKHGLFFPIDLGADPSIGGMVATNTGGAKLLRYGDVQRNLMGLEVVLADADATLLSDMGGLRKDNSGLDWKQLFIGTGGTFGIVSRAKLELQRKASNAATALLVPGSIHALPQILSELEASFGDMLTACEGISRNALELALKHHPALRNPFGSEYPDYCLLIEIATPAAVLADLDLQDALGATLMRFLDGAAPILSDVVIGRGEDFWRIRHSISDGLKRAGRVLGFDLAVSRSQFGAFREEACRLAARTCPEALVCDFGHCGDGGIHFNLVVDPACWDDARINELREQIYDLAVRAFGGTFSAEHGLGPHNHDYYRRYVPAADQALARQLKAILDPKGVIGNVRL